MSSQNGDDDVISRWMSGEECQPGRMTHINETDFVPGQPV